MDRVKKMIIEEVIYQKNFKGLLNKVLEHEFKTDKGEVIILKNFCQSQGAGIEFVRNLTNKISQIPVKKWAIDFSRAIEQNGLNCSCASALMGLILEKAGVGLVEYGQPPHHSLLILNINSVIYYVDPRNGVFEKLDDNVEIEEFKSFRVYKIRKLKGKLGFKIIPASSIKEGIIASYLENLLVEGKLSKKEAKRLSGVRAFSKELSNYENSSDEFQAETKRLERIIKD